MILLKKLQLNNFLSHENTEIDFKENEKALIDGASGAGKSSIFDGILWALYGQGRANHRSLIRKGSKKGYVCLELTRRGKKNEEDTVIITRSAAVSGKNTLEVAIQQTDGSRAAYPLSGIRELQNWIDKDLIGASYLLFINSVAYVQGNSESFVTQTAPKRKELLLEIVKAEDYNKYYEQARKALSGLENDHSRALGQVLELESRLGVIKANLGDREARIKTIEENTQYLKDIEPKIKELEEQRISLATIYKTIDVLDGVLKTAISDKNTIENNLTLKRNKVSDKPRLLKILEIIPTHKADIEKITIKLAELRQTLASISEQEAKRNEVLNRKPRINDRNFVEIDHLNNKIVQIKEKPICPSGIACPYSGDHGKQIDGLHAQIKICEETILQETIAFNKWTTESQQLPSAADIKITLDEIKETETRLRNLESGLAQLYGYQKDIDIIIEIETELPELEKTLEEKNVLIKETKKQKEIIETSINIEGVSIIEEKLLSLKTEQKNFNDNIVKATASLEAIDRDKEEIKNIANKIDLIKNEETVIQEKTRKVGLVKEAFGSHGIETLVIDYLLPKLEDRINEVLAQLSDFRVRLDTQKQSLDGESTIEGLFITILNEMNEEMPFESYSGGEKLKISVAISESLATLQKVGFRLFDETFLGLDENSTEGFAAVLEGLQNNFSQVLCISHLLQIKELFDKKLNVIKTNGISYVK